MFDFSKPRKLEWCDGDISKGGMLLINFLLLKINFCVKKDDLSINPLQFHHSYKVLTT